MSNEKMIYKEVKFIYYRGYLKIDPVLLNANKIKNQKLNTIRKKLLEGKKLTDTQKSILKDEENIIKETELYNRYGRSVWDALKMFEYVLNKKINSNIDIGEINIEIEPNTLKIDNDFISFQLTKLRDNMLPAKKKKGNMKEDIVLEDDEFIGEFTSILYDKKNNIFMVQSNMHGVSIGQVEKYLTDLRRRIIEEMGLDDLVEAVCELSIIIDSFELDNIRTSQEVRKLRFRAADGIYSSLGEEGNFLRNIRKSFGNKTGFVIDLTISIDRETEIKSLDQELIEDVLQNYEDIKASQYDSNLLVEITRKEDQDSPMEILNLLKPKIADEITLKIKPKTSVVHNDLLNEMKKAYNKTKKKIEKIIGE